MNSVKCLLLTPRLGALLATVAVFTLTYSTQSRAATVYAVDVAATTANPTGNPAQTDSVQGSITTDGAVGALAGSDIVSWDLSLVDGLDAANDYELTPSDSTLVESTGLSASASGLTFDYSGSGEFLIQADNPGAFSGYHYFCFSTGGACLAGESISPGFIFSDGVVLTGQAAPVGVQTVGSASGTPEAPAWAMAIVGIAGVGAALRSRRDGRQFAAG